MYVYDTEILLKMAFGKLLKVYMCGPGLNRGSQMSQRGVVTLRAQLIY